MSLHSASSRMASGEDDDPIVEQIDVYLAKSLAEKLYLFQYPVRPSTMTYDHVSHVSAKIKPKQQKVELEMAVNTMGPNYCRSKGEQIALSVDGTTHDESSTACSGKMMDKQTLCSIQATTDTSRYAAAVFRKGELHLTPLRGILQMRPSFSYLDQADGKQREREAAGKRGDSSQDDDDEVKAVTVRFSRPESDWAKRRRVESYEFHQKKQAEEPWARPRYHGVRDGRSEHERQYLFCQAMDTGDTSVLVQSPEEYLAALMLPVAEEKV